MNVCSGVLRMNFAKEVKRINTIHYMGNNCGILAMTARKHLFLRPMFSKYYKVIFHTHFDLL